MWADYSLEVSVVFREWHGVADWSQYGHNAWQTQILATEAEFQELLGEFKDQRWHKMGTIVSFTEVEFQPGMYDKYYRRASAIAHGQPYVTVRNGKVVTRRAGWEHLSIGAEIMAGLLMAFLLTVVNRQFKLAWDDAEGLAEKVESGFFTEEVALEVARRILYANAMELYNLEKS